MNRRDTLKTLLATPLLLPLTPRRDPRIYYATTPVVLSPGNEWDLNVMVDPPKPGKTNKERTIRWVGFPGEVKVTAIRKYPGECRFEHCWVGQSYSLARLNQVKRHVLDADYTERKRIFTLLEFYDPGAYRPMPVAPVQLLEDSLELKLESITWSKS